MKVNANTEEVLKEHKEQKEADASSSSEKILGKFNTHEDLEKAYQELEKKLSDKQDNHSDNDDENSDVGEEEKEKETEGEEEEEKKETEGDSNSKLVEMVEKYVEDGEVDEKALEEEFGLTPKHLEIYKKGIEAEVKEAEGKLHEAAGSVEDYNAIMAWAAEALNKEDIESYNKELTSGDLRRSTMAVKALKSDYLNSSNKETTTRRRITNTSLPKHSSDTYKSDLEIQRDMKDHRYYSDKAFRAEVEDKMKRSYKLGTVSKERGKAGWRISK